MCAVWENKYSIMDQQQGQLGLINYLKKFFCFCHKYHCLPSNEQYSKCKKNVHVKIPSRVIIFLHMPMLKV